MKKQLYICSLLTITVMAQFRGFSQGAWAKPRGEGYFQISQQYFSSTQYYNLSGEQLNTNQFSQLSTQFYGEYGFTKRITVVSQLPLLTFNRFENTEWVGGLGDLQIGIRYALLKKKFPVSISISPQIPTGNANRYAQSTENDFDEINLPTGDGEFNVWSYLAVGHSFLSGKAYGTSFAGFNYRTKYQGVSFSNQLSFGAEVGYKVFNYAWLIFKLQGLNSLGDSPARTDFIRGEGTSYSAIAGNLAIPIRKDFNFIATYQNFNDWVFKRNNIYSSAVLSIGISYELKKN